MLRSIERVPVAAEMDRESVASSDGLVKSLNQMVVTTSTPSASFQSFPREIRDKIYDYIYERPADYLKFVWLPRTTFAINRQLYAEAQQRLLKRHVFVKVSMRLKHEFLDWMINGPHTKGWLIQTGDSGGVTQFKHYHMHIQIGPVKKQLPLTSIQLLGHEALVTFCARFVLFAPEVLGSSMLPRRLRVRIACLQPTEPGVINRALEGDLYESLLTVWWSFEDVQVVSANDKEAAIKTRKLLSGDRWESPDDYVDFIYAKDVLMVFAIAEDHLQEAIQLARRQRYLRKIVNTSMQYINWQSNSTLAAQLNKSAVHFLLVDLEIHTRVVRVAESAVERHGNAGAAFAVHDELQTLSELLVMIDQDSNLQNAYLLSLCFRYTNQFEHAADFVRQALENSPEDRRLQRERVILKILTNKNLAEEDLAEKGSEFRRYPIEQCDRDITLALGARAWRQASRENGMTAQDFIMANMRTLRDAKLIPSYS